MKAHYMIEFECGLPAIADVSFVDLEEDEHDLSTGQVFVVHRINVPAARRGNGYGSRLLKEICEDADCEGARLMLTPYASGDLDDEQLGAWYERYGFAWNDRHVAMYREPLRTQLEDIEHRHVSNERWDEIEGHKEIVHSHVRGGVPHGHHGWRYGGVT